MFDFYFIYGVKNLSGNRKIVVTVEHSIDHLDVRYERDRSLSQLLGDSWVPGPKPQLIGQTAMHAGAHELYVRDPLPEPLKRSAGVGEALPAGSRLIDWGWNDWTYTTMRPDGRMGPLADVWPG